MNRPLKFRAWDKTKKIMHQPAWSFEKPDNGAVIQKIHPHGSFSFDEIMQFTGLLDKAGKEIYEGDVIKYSNGKLGVVVWMSEQDGFDMTGWVTTGSYFNCTDFSGFIIGNLFENPELIIKP